MENTSDSFMPGPLLFCMKIERSVCYKVTDNKEEKGKNQKLRAQLNRDHENSSIPSSKSLRPKKVANSREKQVENPEPSPGIRVTAVKNRNQQFPRSFCRHRKQSLKTQILKRLPKRS